MKFGKRQKNSDSSTLQLAHGVIAHIGGHLLSSGKRPVRCWTYITQGLRQFRQKEIIIALNMPAGEAPQAPAMLLDAVARLAAQGRLVDVGGFTEFGDRTAAALGRRSKLAARGIGYAQAHGIDPIVAEFGAASKDFIAAILLAQMELDTAQRFGLARMLTHLSRHYCCFPYPIWNDPNRPELISPDFAAATQFGHFGGIVSIQGVMPFREEGGVKLRIAAAAMPHLGELLAACFPKKTGLLLPTTDGWSEAPACLVWHPGQHGPAAISSGVSREMLTHFDAPGQRLLGCSIGFLIAARDEGAIMIEDAFVVFLSEEHAEQLADAMAGKISFNLEASGAMMDFSLVPRR